VPNRPSFSLEGKRYPLSPGEEGERVIIIIKRRRRKKEEEKRKRKM